MNICTLLQKQQLLSLNALLLSRPGQGGRILWSDSPRPPLQSPACLSWWDWTTEYFYFFPEPAANPLLFSVSCSLSFKCVLNLRFLMDLFECFLVVMSISPVYNVFLWVFWVWLWKWDPFKSSMTPCGIALTMMVYSENKTGSWTGQKKSLYCIMCPVHWSADLPKSSPDPTMFCKTLTCFYVEYVHCSRSRSWLERSDVCRSTSRKVIIIINNVYKELNNSYNHS